MEKEIEQKKEKSLEDIGRVFKTDKVEHGFCKRYDELFSSRRNDVKYILEIGVYFGSSINMWKEYFPNAVVYGMDHFQGIQGNGEKFENPEEYYVEMQRNPDERIFLVAINQEKLGHLEQFVNYIKDEAKIEFDIIIEDGSHSMQTQQQTMGMLFPILKSGGIYVVEDLHTSRGDPPQYGIDSNRLNTTLEMFVKHQNIKKWESEYLTSNYIEYLQEHTESSTISFCPNNWSNVSILGIVTKK